MIKERILLVEDNRSLSKLIAKKMDENLNMKIIQAYNYKEAEEILEDNDDFFISLLDLNLPDAPDGEIVDLLISKNIPVIVLTGSLDEKIREKMLSKGIIDYVYKGNIDDINYIFQIIQRLEKNRDIKILTVNSSNSKRAKIKQILQKQMFKVLVAAHGEEALSYIKENPDIQLVLTDYEMPVVNGLELTKEIRKEYNKNKLFIISTLKNNEHSISAKFLKLGANDFINEPFLDEELICRVNNALDTKEYLEKITDMAHLDFLTGLYNRRYFFENIDNIINKENFAVAMIDIDNFKNINDTFGHDVGDMVIKNLSQVIKNSIKGSDIGARFGGEEFSVALGDVSEKNAIGFFIKLKNLISKQKIKYKDQELSYTVSIGLKIGEKDENQNIDTILKEADNALYRAKKNGKNRVEISEN